MYYGAHESQSSEKTGVLGTNDEVPVVRTGIRDHQHAEHSAFYKCSWKRPLNFPEQGVGIWQAGAMSRSSELVHGVKFLCLWKLLSSHI